MSEKQTGAQDPGYETRDVNVRAVAALAIGALFVTILAMTLMVSLFDHLERREEKSQPPPATLAARPETDTVPEPRLQDSPVRDRIMMMAEEEKILNGYGWVDRRAGIVRIPIERAMEQVVEQGLPARNRLVEPGGGE